MATTATVRRYLVAHELRRVREKAGRTQDEAAEHLDCRVSKISRLELGQSNVGIGDLKLLLEYYGDDEEHVELMVEMARGQRQRGRWTGHRAAVTEWFRMYFDLEQDASTIRQVQAEIIPGLLQTEGYMQALYSQPTSQAISNNAGDLMEVRRERQAILSRNNPPELSFVLSESCLRRMVGDAPVMLEQLQHLMKLAKRPHIQLQVLPFDAPTLITQVSQGFIMLSIPAPGVAAPLDFVYVECVDDGRYLDSKEVVATYVSLWGRLQAAALGPVESSRFIQNLARQLA